MLSKVDVISILISKCMDDCIDITKDAIKRADFNRKAENQGFQTRIYQVIIDALNALTYNRYKGQDILYNAAEEMLKNFKISTIHNMIEDVKSCLTILNWESSDDRCKELLRLLRSEVSKSQNTDLFNHIMLLQHESVMREVDQVKQLVEENNEGFIGNTNIERESIQPYIKNRRAQYADRWNENMFLNSYNKRDENAGVNVKLRDVYLESHLPHYIWKTNYTILTDLKDLLTEYLVDNNNRRQMLLILGQPGIGKSTLITWIAANFINEAENILVYQFASDLEMIDWSITDKNYDMSSEILRALGLTLDTLNGKILILDGFDEINVGRKRIEILNHLYWKLVKNSPLKQFSLIITCRENYIQNMNEILCSYITLQPWDSEQIVSFCSIYEEKVKNNISEGMIRNILNNKEILGVPLILYMVLALDIIIEEESSIVYVYDQIFSLNENPNPPAMLGRIV